MASLMITDNVEQPELLLNEKVEVVITGEYGNTFKCKGLVVMTRGGDHYIGSPFYYDLEIQLLHYGREKKSDGNDIKNK